MRLVVVVRRLVDVLPCNYNGSLDRGGKVKIIQRMQTNLFLLKIGSHGML